MPDAIAKAAVELPQSAQPLNASRVPNRALMWMVIGAVMLALAVILGAFGAHGLKAMLTASQMAVYQTAVQYHFYHGVGVILVGLIMYMVADLRAIEWVARCLFMGVILFSGSLYGLTLTEIRWLGVITPLGGVLFIVGWLILAVSLYQKRQV